MFRSIKIFQILLCFFTSPLVTSLSFAGPFTSLSKASGDLFNKKIVKISETGVIDLKDIEMTPEIFEKMLNELESFSDDKKNKITEFILGSSYTTIPKSKEFKDGAGSRFLGLLAKFPNLLNLELAGLHLDKEGEALLNALETLKQLQRADFSKNNLDFAISQKIAEVLIKLPDFKEFILKENKLNNGEKEALKDQFEVWKPSKTGTTFKPLLDI